MNFGPHREDEIVQAAKLFLANKSFQQSTTMVSVILKHVKDGVNYGYDVYFRKVKKQSNILEWELESISNTTSP